MTTNAITLRPLDLHWLDEMPAVADLCSHGSVEFTIGADVLLNRGSGEFTLSAAALLLLRTLTNDRAGQGEFDGHLFPCCGFNLYAVDGQADVLILGCPNGAEFGVVGSGATCAVRAPDGRTWTVRCP